MRAALFVPSIFMCCVPSSYVELEGAFAYIEWPVICLDLYLGSRDYLRHLYSSSTATCLQIAPFVPLN